MDEPFLIAHRVRGEPAFDIAIQLEGSGTESDPGPWWIIPTSGHRAYPYWSINIRDLCFYEGSLGYADDGYRQLDVPSMPLNWPDHYQATAAPKGQGTIAASSLLERLGLLRKATIRRR